MSKALKFVIRLIFETFFVFVLVYLYAIEIQQRHFLHFSNGEDVTIFRTSYLVYGKYYGLLTPKQYNEVVLPGSVALASDAHSSKIFATNIRHSFVPTDKIEKVDANSTKKWEYHITGASDPMPEFVIETDNGDAIAQYLLFINPVISAFISGITAIFILFCCVIFFMTYCRFTKTDAGFRIIILEAFWVFIFTIVLSLLMLKGSTICL